MHKRGNFCNRITGSAVTVKNICYPRCSRLRFSDSKIARFLVSACFLALLSTTSSARDKDVAAYGEGFIINLPLPEPEVAQVVQEVAQSTIIHGTKEYNRDEYVSGAEAASSTPCFKPWTEEGKVFYKVKKNALDPRGFKNSTDLGTLAVRYIVQVQGYNNTVLRIDAVFVEDVRRTSHPSDGTVESAEYKDIQEHLDAVELMKKENEEAIKAKQEKMARENFGLGSDSIVLSTPPQDSVTTGNSSRPGKFADSAETDTEGETLAQRVANLKRQVERVVKKPGAPLKSAPFHSASTLVSLNPGAEVLIQVSTPYWYGVETHEGQHGWLEREQLEQAP
jgi:hypothetical protein